MGGRASRQKGHRYEVACANELSERLGLDVVTTRSLGANYGADLATVIAYDAHGRPAMHLPSVLGWSVETKNVKRRNPAGWLRQAREQAAPGRRPVVLWKRPRAAWEEGSVFLDDAEAPRGWVELPIHEWLSQGWTRPRREDADEVADRIMADRLADGYY